MHGLGGTVDTDPLASGAGPSYAADQPLSIAPSSLFDSHPGSTAGDSHYHYPAPGPSRHAFVLPLSVPPFHAEPRDHRPSLGAAVESSRWSANVSHVSQPLPHLQPAHMTDFVSPSCGYPEGSAAPLPVASTSASFGTGNGSTRIRLDQHTVNDETASASVKPFISKLYHLLSHPDSYQDCVVWDGSGNSFIINSNKRFARDVLPQVFGHSNIASFTRQLNVYGFRRMSTAELMSRVNVTSPETYSAWQHALFTRDDRSTLHLLCPRPSRARVLKKAEKAEKQEREREDKAQRTRAVQQRAANAAAQAVGVGPGVPALAAPPVLYPPALQPVPALAARRPYVPYAYAPPPQPSEADRSETSTTSFESSMPLSPVTPPAPPSLELHFGDGRIQHSFSHSSVKGLGQYRW